jgi:peptide deformylase
MKKILQIGDPTLEKKSKIVKKVDSPKIQDLVKDLVAICKKKEKITGGLAAPQIGVLKQVVVVRRLDIEDEYQKKMRIIHDELKDNLWLVMINPKVVKKGKKKDINWEGCLSVKHGKLFGPVERSTFIKVKYLDESGNEQELVASGYFASATLHEIDHLRGTLFVKYVKNLENLWSDKKLDAYINEYGEFPEIK